METGRMLLHYRLIAKIGEGGMGVVWKALDTSLGREVAIKVLPELFALDADRLARFEREARLLALLNHPNIAAVHGLNEAPATGTNPPVRFLAMEMVTGEDLAARIARGPLPLDDALAVATQIASALEAAHSQGVVHRDLKPANVVLTAGGTAKVLDFGLAKVMDPDASSTTGVPALSPTMTSAGTVAGMILGTAAYMSPEQARGKPVDRRADLWSFGCVVYECLTGLQLFRGETVSDSLAAILRKEPDWSLLPADTPPLVRLLLRRCLARDARKRLQDAGDARLELEQAIDDPRGEILGLAPTDTAAAGSRFFPRLPWAVAALALVAAVFFLVRGAGSTPEPLQTRRLMIPVPGATEFGDQAASPPAVSPDGRSVAFGVMDENGDTLLSVRRMDDFAARTLDNTAGAEYAFWSSDSRHVGFFAGGKLKRIEIATGRVQTVADVASTYPRGGSWNAQGQIIHAPNSNTGIWVVDATGGQPRQITTPDADIPDGSHRWPWFLPDGEHFLFTTWTNDLAAKQEHGGVYVASLSGDRAPVRVASDASCAVYVPPGFLMLVRGDNLIALPFDARAQRVTGEATVVASDVLFNRANGHGAFSSGADGTLVYAAGQAFAFLPSALTWYDRDGNTSPTGLTESASHTNIRLAPDARRAATVLPGESGDGQIWIVDLVRGVRTRLVQGGWQFDYPMWSADGKRVLFTSQENGILNFFVRSADGSGDAEPIFVDGQDKILFDWTRDGSRLAYWPLGSGSGTSDIWIYSIERKKAEPLASGEPTFRDARFSPDGRWVAYVSDDSGRMEVYVQGLVDQGDGVRGGARWQLSTVGGDRPHWRDDGREVVYLDPARRVMAVTVEQQQDRLTLGAPRELFTIERLATSFDATGDHERFLVATRDEVSTEPLRVVLSWHAGVATP